MRKLIYLGCACALWLSSVTMVGCQKSPDLKDVILVTGTEVDPMVKFPVEVAPVTYSLSATSTTQVPADVNVVFEVNPDALTQYNEANGTHYFLMPSNAYELLDPAAVIAAGKNTSTVATVRITSLGGLSNDASYVIPISIKSASGDIGVLEAGRTIFLRVAQVLGFTSLDVTPNGSANNQYAYKTFYFNHGLEMSAYTFEMKFMIDSWHTAGDGTTITRLANWGPGDKNPFGRTQNSMCLLRLGEGGYAKDQLQWLTSSGALATITPFTLGQWYMATFTYDGFTYKLYVDGKLVTSMDAAGATNYFDSLEIGMSWNGNDDPNSTSTSGNVYGQRQKIPGRICEMRMWNRALKAKEIASGICGVPTNSSGLISYWKMNEGTGYVYHDSTGGGRDLQGHYPGEGNLWAQGYFTWASDSRNKCAQ